MVNAPRDVASNGAAHLDGVQKKAIAELQHCNGARVLELRQRSAADAHNVVHNRRLPGGARAQRVNRAAHAVSHRIHVPQREASTARVQAAA